MRMDQALADSLSFDDMKWEALCYTPSAACFIAMPLLIWFSEPWGYFAGLLGVIFAIVAKKALQHQPIAPYWFLSNQSKALMDWCQQRE